MAREQLRQSLPEILSEVLGDFADLFRKELQLARAELSSNISTKLRGGVWLGIAVLSALLAVALVLGALVAWLATFGVSLHVAFLMVAVGMALLAVFAYLAGRDQIQTDLTPLRTINQVKQDIQITKEQLT